MTGIRFSILTAIGAFLVGIAIGHYATTWSSKPELSHPQSSTIESNFSSTPALPFKATASLEDSVERSTSPGSSSENIIADLKAALAHSGSRHSYAAFSKLVESLDEKHVQEALAFAQNLPKDDKSTTLLSLLVGRWAEFD